MENTAFPPSVHAHEFLDLLSSRPTGWSSEALFEAAGNQFGPDCRFDTCSTQGLTLPELIGFLLNKGRILQEGGQLILAECSCGH